MTGFGNARWSPTSKTRLPLIAALVIGAILLALLSLRPQVIPGGKELVLKLRGKKTVQDRIQQYDATVDVRWKPYFARAGVLYPPHEVRLVGLKAEKQLEVYARDEGKDWRFVRSIAVIAASGKVGPKLREGDYQVPEGVYALESLNPNSAYHLALRVNYPNQFDREKAAQENRTDLGGDIMIHGSNGSVGCLAIGDEAAEDVFVLVAKRKVSNLTILLAPADFRTHRVLVPNGAPEWTAELYKRIKDELEKLPVPRDSNL